MMLDNIQQKRKSEAPGYGEFNFIKILTNMR